MAYQCANTDRISHLPSEIIQKILHLLPCRDAVKTSILSSYWRYKWMSMSDLNFGVASGTSDAKFITKCLRRHQGPIRKFSVTAHTLTIPHTWTVGHKIEQWMQLVSKHDIEELQVVLDIADPYYCRFPSCLFNCKKLTHLELFGCLLDVPPAFEGFMNLKVLNLSNIDVEDKSSIESLISKSPLLERISLHIIILSGVSNITVSAPKVKYLSLLGNFKDICLKESPVLVDMRLHVYGCDLIKIFGDAPNLFNCKKLTHLELEGDMLTIPPTFEGFMNLKSLKLTIVREVDKSSTESLISKSPLLESLIFVSYGSNTPVTVSAPKLKCLSLQSDLKSISLEKSPVLADMSIYLDGDSRDCDLIKILAGVPNLEKLAVNLGWKLVERFKFGCYRGVLSTTFTYLKVMTLGEFNLGESKAMQFVLELLRSAPNLEKLVIYNIRFSHSLPNEADSDFWQKEYLVGHCFMKLKVVELVDILCKAPEIEFAKFILSKSPILEKMTIGTREKKQAIVTHTLKKLLTLPRASPRAAVTFHDGDSWRPNCSLEI